MFYILDRQDKPKAVAGAMAWAYWRQRHPEKLQVELTKVDGITISTVFLGLDHSISLSGPPKLFETMIFGGERSHYQTRCSTIEQARVMHAAAINVAQSKEVKEEPLQLTHKEKKDGAKL